MPDLTKLIMYSKTPGFKNNHIYTGSIVLPSSNIVTNGLAEYYFDIVLLEKPNIIDASFSTSALVGGIDGAPNLSSGQWFKPGVFGIVHAGSGSSSELFYQISWMTFVQDGVDILQIRLAAQKSATGTFIPSGAVTINYRFVDYSSL